MMVAPLAGTVLPARQPLSTKRNLVAGLGPSRDLRHGAQNTCCQQQSRSRAADLEVDGPFDARHPLCAAQHGLAQASTPPP